MRYTRIRRRIQILRFLSSAVSILLHPLLMPTLIFAIIFQFCPAAVDLSPRDKVNMLWLLFVITFLFPFVSTFVLFYILKRGFSINDLLMENNSERFYPFLFTGLFYSAITYMFINDIKDATIIVVMGGISLTVLLVAVITYFWKISAHAVGICGAWGFILVVSYFYPYEELIFPVGGLALLAGILMSARLYLRAHTNAQVYLGALLGLFMSVASFVLLQKYALPLIF